MVDRKREFHTVHHPIKIHVELLEVLANRYLLCVTEQNTLICRNCAIYFPEKYR